MIRLESLRCQNYINMTRIWVEEGADVIITSGCSHVVVGWLCDLSHYGTNRLTKSG